MVGGQRGIIESSLASLQHAVPPQVPILLELAHVLVPQMVQLLVRDFVLAKRGAILLVTTIQQDRRAENTEERTGHEQEVSVHVIPPRALRFSSVPRS